MYRLLALAHERLSDIYGEAQKFKEGARHLKIALQYQVIISEHQRYHCTPTHNALGTLRTVLMMN
jgi:hypothetical protein